jgi:hypothetical protein
MNKFPYAFLCAKYLVANGLIAKQVIKQNDNLPRYTTWQIFCIDTYKKYKYGNEKRTST